MPAFAITLQTFRIGSEVHLAAVSVCVIAAVAASWIGRGWRRERPGAERALRITWAIFTLLTQLVAATWYAWPSRFEWRLSLPLHICDIVAVLAAVSLLRDQRWVWSVVYFWGIGLCILGFIWPSLTHGPDRIEFYLFWLTHLQIVGSAVYLVAVRGYVPRAGDWAVAQVLLALYCIIIVPIDWMFDLNYGYIGPADSPTSIMGPWPARVLIMFAVQMLVLALLLAPPALLGGATAAEKAPE